MLNSIKPVNAELCSVLHKTEIHCTALPWTSLQSIKAIIESFLKVDLVIKKIKGLGGLAFMSLCGEICFYCVSVAKTSRNCFSIGAGMPPPLLFGVPMIPSESPIEYMCSLFPGKQGSHPSYKPRWWIVWRTLEEYKIYSKEQLGIALSLTLGFPKCWLHLSWWWQNKQEGYFPIVDLVHRMGRAVIC